MADEKRPVQERLQLTNLTADRGLRDEEFFRRAAEAQVTSGRFKTSQSCQGQAATLHSYNLKLSDGDIILV